MAPPVRGSKHPITAFYSFIDLVGMKGRVGWPVADSLPTSGHPPAAGRAGQGKLKFAGQRPTFYHCATSARMWHQTSLSVYISLPYIKAARTAGIDKNEEITSSLSPEYYYYFLINWLSSFCMNLDAILELSYFNNLWYNIRITSLALTAGLVSLVIRLNIFYHTQLL